MATVQHSTLTGADLHECKGADSAASGTVPIANGSGAAAFAQLSYTQLSGTPVPKLQLNGVASTGQALVKLYTTSASSGTWSVTLSGFSTIWGVFATCVSGGTAIGTAAVATVATVSTTTVTGSVVVQGASANTLGTTQSVQLLVIGV